MLLAAGPAAAHTGFESSNPVDGSTIGGAVDVITIAFSGPAEPTGDGFVVLDSSGTVRAPDVVRADTDQQAWTLGFDPPLTDGAVGVRWTVQAPDAHPISGSFSFIVDADGAVVGEASPEIRAPASGVTPDSNARGASDRSSGRRSGEIRSEAVADHTSRSTTEGDGRIAESRDLEAFLSQSDQSAPQSAAIGTFGRLLGFIGTMLGIGGLCFGAAVVRDHRRDLGAVLGGVRYAALALVAGTGIEFSAHLAKAGNGWWEIFSAGAVQSATLSTFGLAVGLRLIAGSVLFATARLADRTVERREVLIAQRELVPAGGPPSHEPSALTWIDPDTDPDDSRYRPSHTSPLGQVEHPISTGAVVAVALLLLSFTLDGHTVTEGNRWITGAVDMIHVMAASVWAGGVVAFAAVLWRRRRRRERLGGLVLALRFSVIAGAALAVAGVAGTILAVIILDSVSQLWATPWGRLLLAKTLTVTAAAAVGGYNHFVVIPWMNVHPDDDSRSARIRNTATVEAMLLSVVIIVTAFLVGASSQA